MNIRFYWKKFKTKLRFGHFWNFLILGLLLSACVETSECRTNQECAWGEACIRGYCHQVCKTKVENADGTVEDQTTPCSDPEKNRCICIPKDGKNCTDQVESACHPILDDYCLCYPKEGPCIPQCRPNETCVKGACMSIVQ